MTYEEKAQKQIDEQTEKQRVEAMTELLRARTRLTKELKENGKAIADLETGVMPKNSNGGAIRWATVGE